MKYSNSPKNEEQFDQSVLEKVNYCIDILNIEKVDKINKNIDKLVVQYATTDILKAYGRHIVAMKIVAELCASIGINYNQSELYDFLTLTAQAIMVEQTRANQIVLKIYRDIMENYQNFNDSLKLNYPRIIVDVLAIVHTGEDTNHQRVGANAIEEYYQSRKVKASHLDSMPTDTAEAVTTTASAKDMYISPRENAKDQDQKQQLIAALIQITGRKDTSIKDSLTNLSGSDIKRISNLCTNYTKIKRYYKLVDSKEFRHELEKELDRQLTYNQIQRAVMSIKKVSKYIEDLLDKKFVPHESHGINHTKHNLEYGYQLMGLIERSRRR
jgi:hypothetical protein